MESDVHPYHAPPAGGASTGGGWSSGRRFGGKALLAVGVAVAMTIGTVVHRMQQQDLFKALETDGKYARGSLVQITEHRRRSSRTYTAQYQYVVNGVAYYGDKPVTQSEARSLRYGDPVSVMYVASDPKRSIGTSLQEAKDRASLMGTMLIAGSGVVWLAAIWRVARGE
jgi:hypothetical protein